MKARLIAATLALGRMLASLLPGLRELRAPLAAGYLWLIGGWLVLHNRIDSESTAIRELAELRDATTTAGYIAAISFLAFILGALWEAAVAVVVAGVRLVSAERSASPYPRARISLEGQGLLEAIGRRLFLSVAEIVREVHGQREGALEVRKIAGDRRMPANEFVATLYVERIGSPADEWWRQEDEMGSSVDLTADFIGDVTATQVGSVSYFGGPLVVAKQARSQQVWVMSLSHITHRIVKELPLTARRLVGEQQELYVELDRMKAEVDFRFTVAVPLAVAGSLIIVGLQLPTWLDATLIVGAAFAGLMLIGDGIRRDRERSDLLLDLIRIEKATSPTFARLLERAKAMRDRTKEEHAGEPLEAPMSLEGT